MNKMIVMIFALFTGIANAKLENNCAQLLGKLIELKTFPSKIEHPKYYLWDNWGLEVDGKWHVYSLSASRNISESSRHQHAHWRHFTSSNHGKTWQDLGPVLQARSNSSFYDNQAIWSGSVTKLQNGEFVAAYTGLSSERSFLQTISLATSNDLHDFKRVNVKKPLLSHSIQRQEFIHKGYYVDDISKIGNKIGEADGSIQALRDPFIHQDKKGLIHIYWSAKAFNNNNNEIVSAIGHATLNDVHHADSLKILKPVIPPDANQFTQLELPNIIKLSDNRFAWITSTTNRKSETQTLDEIVPRVRLYFSNSLNGKLQPYKINNSILLDSDKTRTYGANVIQNAEGIQLRTFNLDSLNLPNTITLAPERLQ